MTKRESSPLHRQLRRVHRRLFLQTLLDYLAWGWTGALAAAAVWFLVEQPYLFAQPPAWQRWAVAGGLFAVGTVLAVVLAWLRSPSRVSAALEVDQKFGLKERVTTSLLLAPELHTTPAGQALLADADAHLARLDVASGFGIRFSRLATMVPAALAVLAAVAFFYEPAKSKATAKAEEALAAVTNAQEITEKNNQLKKPASQPNPDQVKSEALKELEDELDRIANKPFDTKDQLRERVKELTEKEEKTKSLEQKLADKNQRLKQQLKQLDRMVKKDGPADKLRDALEKGNFKDARDEVERLQKKLQGKDQEGGLTEDEKERLQEQLQEMQEKLERLSQQKEKEDELQRLFREGKIDKETLDRELDQLKKKAKDLKDLEELAREMGECKKCLAQGDLEEAMECLNKACKKLDDLELEDEELRAVRKKLGDLCEAKESMCRGLDGKPVPATGRRPEAKSAETDSVDSREKGTLDTKGQVILGGYAPGRNFKKKPTAEIEAEIKQARQEAPEAIERQNIPRDARDMTRGYFRNLGGQK
jgi:hypothetical protein